MNEPETLPMKVFCILGSWLCMAVFAYVVFFPPDYPGHWDVENQMYAEYAEPIVSEEPDC